MVTGRILPSTVLNPGRRVFAPASLHVAEIESIDVEARTVVTSRRLDGARFELEYDRAVVCVGSGENLEAYPGLAEHAFRLKSFHDCFRLKNHIVEMLELADIETDPEERRRLLTFFVAGGGFSGTELAGELADLMRRLTKREYPGIAREECRVLVVHPGPTLLPELYGSQNTERAERSYPRLVEYAMNHARKLGVELMLETKVVGVTPGEVYLSNGEHVPTRTIVSAVGSKPWPLLDQIPVPARRARTARHGRVPAGRRPRRPLGRRRLRRGPAPARRHVPARRAVRDQARRPHRRQLRRALAGKPLAAVPLGRDRPGDLDREPHCRRGAQGLAAPRQGRVGGVAKRPLVGRRPYLGPPPPADRRLARLAARRTRHRPDGAVADHRLRRAPPRLPAGRDDRGQLAARAARARDRRGRGRRRRNGDSADVLETLGPGDHMGRKWLEGRRAELAPARSRSSAPSRCTRTRRTSSRT